MLSAIASVSLMVAIAVAGIAVVARIFPFTTTLERLAYGSVVGIAGGTLLLVPLATVVGMSASTVGLIAVAAVALAAGLARGVSWRRLFDGRSARGLISRLDPIATLVIGALSLRWALLWRDALEVRLDGLWAGHEYIWSDWPTHLAIVTRFASGSGFPPENIHLAGLPLAYHYLSDLTPAMFVTLGMEPVGALVLHSFVLSVIAALAVWAFGRRLVGRRSAATLGLVLFMMGAGLGWVANVAAADAGQGTLAGLVARPWDPGSQAEAHIRVFNPYLAFLMSQRAYLYGLPLAMLVLSALQVAAARRSVPVFVGAGVMAGLLPLSHLPTQLAMAIVVPVLALAYLPRPWHLRALPLRGWLGFGLTWVIVSVPQLLAQLGGGSGALAATRLQIGWVVGEGGRDETWLTFWLWNAGLLGILCLVAIVVGLVDRHRRPADRIVPPRALRTLLALQVIFVVVNVVVFQPWDWDNHKILVYWMLAAAILAAALLVAVWRRVRGWRPAGRVLARLVVVAAVVGIVAGPTLENAWMLGGGGRYRMLTANQIELADRIRELVPADRTIVSGMGSHDAAQMLSGRQVLMGYWGQLWVSGIDHAQRESEVRRIYQLAPDAAELIDRYGVGAVVIGPEERSNLGADEDAFRARYPVIVETPFYTVFDTR